MTRYKALIEYRGTDYSGWQRQPNVPSIQQAVEEAIFGFCQQEVQVFVAGRTDAGVHARGQVVHFDLDNLKADMSPSEIVKAINAHLRPQPIALLAAEHVDDEFHARFSAVNKLYHYRIVMRPSDLAIEKGAAWQIRRKLDLLSMQKGAKELLGTHDFSSFRDSECQAKSPVKTLNRLNIEVFDYDGAGGEEIIIAAEAQSFLHHQVRNMVGSLVMVGEGKWQPEHMGHVLALRDRREAGPTAPADGLYLVRVDYNES